MNTWKRNIVGRVVVACRFLGTELDGTATNKRKYVDRQQAHSLVADILYGVCCDHPDNDNREEDMLEAEEKLILLEKLVKKDYPDIWGNL